MESAHAIFQIPVPDREPGMVLRIPHTKIVAGVVILRIPAPKITATVHDPQVLAPRFLARVVILRSHPRGDREPGMILRIPPPKIVVGVVFFNPRLEVTANRSGPSAPSTGGGVGTAKMPGCSRSL